MRATSFSFSQTANSKSVIDDFYKQRKMRNVDVCSLILKQHNLLKKNISIFGKDLQNTQNSQQVNKNKQNTQNIKTFNMNNLNPNNHKISQQDNNQYQQLRRRSLNSSLKNIFNQQIVEQELPNTKINQLQNEKSTRRNQSQYAAPNPTQYAVRHQSQYTAAENYNRQSTQRVPLSNLLKKYQSFYNSHNVSLQNQSLSSSFRRNVTQQQILKDNFIQDNYKPITYYEPEKQEIKDHSLNNSFKNLNLAKSFGIQKQNPNSTNVNINIPPMPTQKNYKQKYLHTSIDQKKRMMCYQDTSQLSQSKKPSNHEKCYEKINQLEDKNKQLELKIQGQRKKLQMQIKKNNQQKKLIQSIHKMRKTLLKSDQNCDLKQLWRWIKNLPKSDQYHKS